ncbi:hypothetical protein ACFQX8_23575 [Klenkia terrae]|uniref:hypothetical protein n=1 Tax=Klenkia terrae TaxID=1052259 RepID=UPI003621DF3B
MPRAVHLDGEAVRVLADAGVATGFAAVSAPGAGLRLLDADHRVLAEFPAGRARRRCSTSPTWRSCSGPRSGGRRAWCSRPASR